MDKELSDLTTQYLEQLHYIDKNIDSRILNMKHRLTSYKNDLKDLPPITKQILEQDEQKINDLIRLRQEIINQIDKVPNQLYQTILIQRYLLNQGLKDISQVIDYSERQTKRLYKKAIKQFEEIHKEEID